MSLTYNGSKYDPKKVYLGPEGHWLAAYIPKTPPGLNAALFHEAWNQAAFMHDEDYKQKKLTGFFGRIKNYFRRKKADDDFGTRLMNRVVDLGYANIIDPVEEAIAKAYARTCHKAVRSFGWSFYGTK
jgi:hypothetical protein